MPPRILAFLVSIVGLAGLAACSSELGLAPSKPKSGAIVVGDEPYAVNAGVEILE